MAAAPRTLTISSIRASICALDMPWRAAFRRMFSLPVNSRPKPAPSSISVATRPAAAREAAVKRDDPGEHAQCGGLPRAVSAHDAQRLAGRYPDRDAGEGLGRRQLWLAAAGQRVSSSLSVRARSLRAGNVRQASSSMTSPGAAPQSQHHRQLTREAAEQGTPSRQGQGGRGHDVAQRRRLRARPRVDDRPHGRDERRDRVGPTAARPGPGWLLIPGRPWNWNRTPETKNRGISAALSTGWTSR